MKKNLKKKVIIFDLDGVLINSKMNMYYSWKAVQKKFSLNKIFFDTYFEKIGQPFYKILEKLNIKKNKKKIKECYDSNSILNLKSIKYYPFAIQTLKKLKKRGFILCIVTSKDKKRTNLIVSDYHYLFSIIQCPQKNLKGKPYPDQINKVIKVLDVKKNQCLYVGDTHIDYLASKKSKIDFLFAEWGYSKKSNIYKYSIKKITELQKVLD